LDPLYVCLLPDVDREPDGTVTLAVQFEHNMEEIQFPWEIHLCTLLITEHFNSDERCSKIIRNVGILSQNYTAQPRKPGILSGLSRWCLHK